MCLFRSLCTCAQHHSIDSLPGKLVLELGSLAHETSVESEPLWPPRTVASTHTSEQEEETLTIYRWTEAEAQTVTWSLQTAVNLTLQEQAPGTLTDPDLPVEKKIIMPPEGTHDVLVTLTIVLLCRMKVWKPNQRSFMHNSNATITKASSSRVAWTCRGIKYAGAFTAKPCV